MKKGTENTGQKEEMPLEQSQKQSHGKEAANSPCQTVKQTDKLTE